MLSEAEFLIEPRLVVEAMEEGSEVSVAASDGSAIADKDKGTHGWIIKVDGVAVMQHKGPASGFPMTSYRAEAYGTWSLLLAVVRMFQHCGRNPKKAMRSLCDNKALVNKINEILTRERPAFPNDTLDSDWDAINEILILLQVGLRSC